METRSPFDSHSSSRLPTPATSPPPNPSSTSNPIITTSSAISTINQNTTTSLSNNNNIHIDNNNNNTICSTTNHYSSQSKNMLDDLLHERAAIEPIRRTVPHLWSLLEAEITHLSNAAADAKAAATLSSLATGIVRSNPLPNNLSLPNLTNSVTSNTISQPKRSPSPPTNRKRVKIPVPADKFPEYNFVGRLLGPRGTTLKTLERDYGCKIMIRGKGSIRKDKEPEVRGKPGWEHVFNEPLHVVIEVADTLDDTSASKTLNRAKAAVQVLLVPVPEEQDGLKREQLRALAIMNGTYRGGPARSHDQLSISTFNSSPLPPPPPPQQQQQHHHHMIHPSHQAVAAAAVASGFSMDTQQNLFLGNSMATNPAAASTPNLMAGFDRSLDDTSIYQSIHFSRPIDLFESKSYPNPMNITERHSPSSGDTSPKNDLFNNNTNPTNSTNNGISVLTSKFQHCVVDEFASSSVGDDSPESSHTSEDGEPSTHISTTSYPTTKVKVTSLSPNSNRADTSLSVGGFIGQEFYNGAFSNGPSPNSWDQASPSLPFSSGLYTESPTPSPQVLTTSTSTVSSIDRHNGY